jgi:hypothetical protein
MKFNWKYLLLFLILFGALGFFRENFFVGYNHLMYIKYYGEQPVTKIDAYIENFKDIPYKTLYYLKYPFTLLSVFLFGLLSTLSIKFIIREKKLVRWVIYSYLILLTLAGLSMLFGILINKRLQDDEYTLSRWLLGIAQSPIITIVFLASYKLITQQTKTQSE